MKTLFAFLLFTFVLLCYNVLKAQNVIIVINLSARSSNGSCASGSITLRDMNGNQLGTHSVSNSSYGYTGASNHIIYQANLASGWQGKISASGSSCNGYSADISGQTITYTTNSALQCNYY